MAGEQQPSLFISSRLVKDITEDKSATFKETDNQYVFETKTRYQNNKMFPYQEITIKQKRFSSSQCKSHGLR